ncbi:hypothetical protein CEXT_345411 [Caerostris extrusa]|uniref:Uncharacterized protein n=1 Tax=Caerostris extrusa TaxID=172846 RepID=A0AAV4W4F0_CAEEX|nr:hypothetical protein CEXT_345411 [Caerostris extrusa]
MRQLSLQWIHPAPPNVRRNTLSRDSSQNWKKSWKRNRKKTLLNFLSPRRSATVQWLTFSAFTQRQKDFNNRCPFRKKCEET